jgi:cation diffusion facilitator CzcD-associated flavoprotein CzcO
VDKVLSMKDVTVAIVGAGQAGLAASRELTQEGIDHVVLERGRVGQTCWDRWDSFRLVTPNWSVRLPVHHYDGSDPDGFMIRDEIVSYIERYARACGAPVRENVEVKTIERGSGTPFILSATWTLKIYKRPPGLVSFWRGLTTT